MNLLNPRSRVGAGKQLVVLLTEHVPLFAMLAMGLSAYLENHFKWPNLLAFATAWSLMLAIAIPWYRWAYPAIEPTLQRASNNALKVGVAVIAMAVAELATGGVWAFAMPCPPRHGGPWRAGSAGMHHPHTTSAPMWLPR